MSNIDRPLSPHLQVYRPQLTSVLSILHRLTGVALAFAAPLVVWGLMAAATGYDAFAAFHDFTGSIIGQIMILGWLFSFSYHFWNGIRHLVWDTGRWMTLKSSYASGYAVVILSIICTGAVWCCARY
jgi:succinate dehydrogenase / fumarate reductase cytochrome b subunit